MCQHNQRRHNGVCPRITCAYFSCGESGHHATVCPMAKRAAVPTTTALVVYRSPATSERYASTVQWALLSALPTHPQGQQFRGDLQLRAQHKQFRQKGQGGYYRQAGFTLEDVAQLSRDEIGQVVGLVGLIDEQMLTVRSEHYAKML